MSSDWIPKAFNDFADGDEGKLGAMVNKTNEVFSELSSVSAQHVTRKPAGPTQVCSGCKQAVSGEAISSAGGVYHPKCFECSQCFRPIEGDFTMKVNKRWCKRCVQLAKEDSRDGGSHTSGGGGGGAKMKMVNAEVIPCSICGKELEGKILRVGDKRFHKECFKCHQCSKALSDAFRMWDGFPHCNTCASNKTGFTSEGGDANMRIDPKTGQRAANQDTSKPSSVVSSAGASAVAARTLSPEKSGPKFCGGCGAKNDGAKFCGSCGTVTSS